MSYAAIADQVIKVQAKHQAEAEAPMSVKPPTLSDLVATLTVGGDVDDESVATSLIADAATNPDVMAALVPAVAHEVAILRRHRVRNLERQTSNEASSDPLTERRRLLAERIYIPGKGYLPWGDCTIYDHQARIKFLQMTIHGIAATTERHRAAIAEIKKAGVSCLNDLKKQAA